MYDPKIIVTFKLDAQYTTVFILNKYIPLSFAKGWC